VVNLTDKTTAGLTLHSIAKSTGAGNALPSVAASGKARLDGSHRRERRLMSDDYLEVCVPALLAAWRWAAIVS
jgi:hypothetical protein